MALRLKSHWHDDQAGRSLEEIARAVAFNIWRIAKDKAWALHGQDFVFRDDRQYLEVIAEYVFYMVQITDRLTFPRLDEDQRRTFLTRLALALAHQVQDNSQDLLEPGDYGRPFIDRLNQRSAEYAEFGFDPEEGPSYPFIRHLGFEIQRLMGEGRENRWVIDQVMDKDAWEAYRQVHQVVENLLE